MKDNSFEGKSNEAVDEFSSMRKSRKSSNRILNYAENFFKAISKTSIEELKSNFDRNSFYCNPNITVNAFVANKSENRFDDIPCIDSTRVVLDPTIGSSEGGSELSDYIHANFVNIPGLTFKFIPTQLPLKSTHNNFWRMIYQENVETMIIFCDEEEIKNNEDSPQKLFPNQNNENMQLESIYLMNKKNSAASGLPHSIVEVLPNGCSQSNVVKVIQTNIWPRDTIPDSRIKVLQLLRALKGSSCVLVCNSGIGRCGAFMLIAAMKGCIMLNKPINGVEIMKMIRNQRAYAIQSFKHYLYAYTVIMQYLKIRTKDEFKNEISNFFNKSDRYLN
uniref:Tyrosine-protein phosphatase n=1 Tax=Strongyloides venezuelensis TaxID=75913 RepID=A0A0K0FJC6_STRVS